MIDSCAQLAIDRARVWVGNPLLAPCVVLQMSSNAPFLFFSPSHMTFPASYFSCPVVTFPSLALLPFINFLPQLVQPCSLSPL